MTTEIPEGIATPDRLETRLGSLTSFDGVPDRTSAQKIYDNLDSERHRRRASWRVKDIEKVN